MKKILVFLALLFAAPAFGQTAGQFYAVPTISALSTLSTRPAQVYVAGSSASTDQLGGTYNWVAGSAAVADGFNVVAPSGGATGRWVRQTGYGVGTHSGVLVTNSSGLPSIATTLPAVDGAALTNIDAITLLGSTWASPGTIGSGTPSSGAFTSLTSSADAVLDGVTVGKGISTGGGSDSGKDTVLGKQALSTANLGYLNTALGYQSLKSLSGVSGGYTNTAVGALSMYSTTIGLENSGLGYRVLFSNVDGYQNTVAGSNAMYYNTGGYNNAAFGMYSLFSNTGSISAPNGFSNSGFGFSALYGNTTGTRNSGFGSNACFSQTTGSFNLCLGFNSAYDLIDGDYNFIGGYNSGAGLLHASNNTILGANITGLSSTLSGAVILASGAGGVGSYRLFCDSAGACVMGSGTTTSTAKLTVTGGDLYAATGALGIGNSSLTGYTIRTGKNITGATTAHNIFASGSVQSDVTGAAYMVRSQPLLAASAFNLSFLYHFAATQGVFGAGSSNSVQYGFFSDSSLVGATTNYGHYAEDTAAVVGGKTAYGFYSNVNVASGGGTTWGFYGGGTALNRFNSDLTIYGGTAIPANGTAAVGYKFSSTANFGTFFGSGAPTLSAAQGSLYLRSDGLPYYNTNGTTGWGQLAPIASPTFTGTLAAPTINATTAYQANGTPGASCTVGTLNPATAVVVNGIITTC